MKVLVEEYRIDSKGNRHLKSSSFKKDSHFMRHSLVDSYQDLVEDDGYAVSSHYDWSDFVAGKCSTLVIERKFEFRDEFYPVLELKVVPLP